MATITINVTEEMAQTIAALPDANREAYLADVNAFAAIRLSRAGTKAPLDNANRQANGNGHAAPSLAEPQGHILDPSEDTTPLTEADAEALREAFADFDAGDRGKPLHEAWANMAAKYGFKKQKL